MIAMYATLFIVIPIVAIVLYTLGLTGMLLAATTAVAAAVIYCLLSGLDDDDDFV